MMVLLVIAGLICLGTGGVVVYALWTVHRMPRLRDQVLGESEGLPRLSVVVPARDEADNLRPALESLLASTYPDLEVVLVNDRSGDETGAIMETLAQGDSRVTVVHVRELPPGWLGKLNAMQAGTEASTGAVLLFTDADVNFGVEALEKAVVWLEREQLDHLTLLPRLLTSSLMQEALVGCFGALYFVAFPPSRVNRDAPHAYAGVGAFNMVRREVFERTEGWEWLRLEIGDDVGLGYLMNRHGAKGRFGLATRDLSIEWYPSVPETIRGLEKNSYVCGAQGKPYRAVIGVLCLMAPLTAFSLCIWAKGAVVLWWVAVVMLVASQYARLSGARLLAGALAPFCGPPIIAWALLRSAWRCHRSGEVAWRGTSYSLKELAAGQRVQVGRRPDPD